MKRSKTVKQLMALGISRNDAAGFVSTYNRLLGQNRLEYLQGIAVEMRLQPKAYVQEKNVIKYSARRVLLDDDDALGRLPQEEREGVIKSRLLEELCRGVVRSEAVAIEKRRFDAYGGYTEFIARISVVKP